MHRVARGLAAILGVGLLVAACSGNEPDRSAAPTTSVSSTTLVPTTTGATSTTAQARAASSAQFRAAKVRLVMVAQLEQPVAMAVRPGDRTLYLVEQVGRVRAVRGGSRTRPRWSTSPGGHRRGEQGLPAGLLARHRYPSLWPTATERGPSDPADHAGPAADPGWSVSSSISHQFGNHNGAARLRPPPFTPFATARRRHPRATPVAGHPVRQDLDRPPAASSLVLTDKLVRGPGRPA